MMAFAHDDTEAIEALQRPGAELWCGPKEWDELLSHLHIDSVPGKSFVWRGVNVVLAQHVEGMFVVDTKQFWTHVLGAVGE